jgi:hypothetical protein
MKSSFARIPFSIAILAVMLVATSAHAQFAKPVVVLKGSVMTIDAKPAVVRLSIHETGSSTADADSEITTCGIQEITAGRANSESGRYLLVLKPGKKYWVHIEGTFVQSLDTLIEMPQTDKGIQLEKNFVVNWKQSPAGGEPPAAKKD